MPWSVSRFRQPNPRSFTPRGRLSTRAGAAARPRKSLRGAISRTLIFAARRQLQRTSPARPATNTACQQGHVSHEPLIDREMVEEVPFTRLSLYPLREVEDETRRNVRILAEDSGYVFCNVHNIVAEITPKKCHRHVPGGGVLPTKGNCHEEVCNGGSVDVRGLFRACGRNNERDLYGSHGAPA